MEYLTESLPSLLGAASAAVPMLQSQRLHQREMQKSIELHREAIVQALEIHEESKEIGYSLHKDALAKALGQHLEDIQLTIEAARRENLRDVWAQKSRRAETTLIMSSLMISGFFTLVVEGEPPKTAWPQLIAVYAGSLALGFFALFVALSVTMKYSSRMSDFNIYDVRQVYVCGRRHEAFESYYECHCKQWAKLATLGFYTGTMMLIVAASLLQFSRWTLGYANVGAGIVFVVISAIGLIVFGTLNLIISTKTRASNTMSEEEAAERDAQDMDDMKLGQSTPVRRVNSAVPFLGRIKSFERGQDGRKRKKGVRVEEEEATAFSKYLSQMNLSSRQNGESTETSTAAVGGDLANDNFVYEPGPTHELFGPTPPAPVESFMTRTRRKISTRPNPGIVVSGQVVNRDPSNLENTLSRKTQRKLDRTRTRGRVVVVDESTDESSARNKEQNEVEMVDLK